MATLTETFTNIANSIRLKTETTDKITPENMPSMIEGITTGGNVAELSITSNGTYRAPEGIDGYTPVIVNVPQDGSPPAEALVISGHCGYRFANNGWNWFIDEYKNQIITKDIDVMNHMFSFSSLKSIPFDINCKKGYICNAEYMFANCSKLEVLPTINNLKVYDTSNMFNYCERLREIPDNICDTWDWSGIDNATSSYSGEMASMFNNCYSLRKIPQVLLSHCNPIAASSYVVYYGGFYNCNVLDELVDLIAFDFIKKPQTYDMFYNGFEKCSRLARLTFKINEDGTPQVVYWKGQTIDLSKYVGYVQWDSYITNYNSGITSATRITDDATYQALKDNPDNWTSKEEYSRYNKTSAIETINSLPDASAYLASAGGTNTIKFKGNAGSKTDGGAINTMTEEEIAVATAKGWTVSFA